MFKIVKRTDATRRDQITSVTVAVLCALVVSSIMFAFLGQNPLTVLVKLVEGSIGNGYRLVQTINKTIPLVVLSLAVAIAFKMKFWNIGAEGQFYCGAIGATYVALFCPNLPAIIMLPTMMLISIVLGGLWAVLPAFLKLQFGASESLTTLMLNYVVIQFVSYLQNGPWRDPASGGMPRIARFGSNGVLPTVFGVHIGWIIAILLVVFMHWLLNKSKLGYEISVLGESEMTARYAGMRIRRIMYIAVFISGALCGLTGMMQASAIERSLTSSLSGGIGFTAIMTSWLAKLKPFAIVIVSFLFAMLIQGGMYIQGALQVSATVSSLIQGIVLFFVLGSDFFVQYRIVRTGDKHEEVQA